MADNEKPQLTEAELKSFGEIHISIDLKGWAKGWKKICYDAPVNGYQWLARKVEGFSRKLMTGKASLLSMPLGIILRNSSRAAYNSSDSRYYHSVDIVAGLAAVATTAAATVYGAPLVAGYVGTWGAYVAVGTVAALVVPVPAYTAALLISSTIVSTAALAFPTVLSAPVNLLVAFRRSKASLKGINLTEEQLEKLQTEFDRDSPSVKHERNAYSQVTNGLQYLSREKKEKIYLSLKEEFGSVADKTVEEKTVVAAPEAKVAANTPN